MQKKIDLNPRLVLLIVIATIAAGVIGWALWGHEYGLVFASSIVFCASIYAFFKKPISE